MPMDTSKGSCSVAFLDTSFRLASWLSFGFSWNLEMPAGNDRMFVLVCSMQAAVQA